MKRGITVVLPAVDTAQPTVIMQYITTYGISANANPTWTVFGNTGNEQSGATPPHGTFNVVPKAVQYDQLYVHLFVTPAAATSVAVTFKKSTDNGATWTSTTLTASIANPATDATDLTHVATYAAGDLIAVTLQSTGATGIVYYGISVRETT